ncbi:MAG: hypothetical protein HDQ93_03285 [Desulfovibrio sp.]|nr:hypothetical protein [Desulfovibrio sp.]
MRVDEAKKASPAASGAKLPNHIGEAWPRPWIYISCYLAYAAWYIARDWRILSFPNDYVWGELFINYQAGFIRRGLFGQILWLIEPYADIRLFALVLVTVVFFCLVAIAYRQCLTAFGKLPTLLFLVWPSYFLFIVKDAGGFLRRDSLVDLIILLATVAIADAWMRKSSIFPVSALFAVLFCFSCLLFEAAIFYWPLPCVLLGLLFWRAGHTRLWFAFSFILFAAALFYAFRFPGTEEMGRAIYSGWQSVIPDFTNAGGMRFLGRSMTDNALATLSHLSNIVTATSVVGAFILALLPLLALSLAFPLLAVCKRIFHGWRLPILILAFLSPFVICVVADDYGRRFSMLGLNYLFFFIAIQRIEPSAPRAWLKKLEDSFASSVK